MCIHNKYVKHKLEKISFSLPLACWNVQAENVASYRCRVNFSSYTSFWPLRCN